MKVKILEAVGHVAGEPLVVGNVMDVPEESAAKMIAAGVAEEA